MICLNVRFNRQLRTSRILLCSTCVDARGMIGEDLMDGTGREIVDEPAAAALAADKVLVF